MIKHTVADFDGSRNTWFYAEIEYRAGRDPRHPQTVALELTFGGDHTGSEYRVRRTTKSDMLDREYVTLRSFSA